MHISSQSFSETSINNTFFGKSLQNKNILSNNKFLCFIKVELDPYYFSSNISQIETSPSN